MYLQVRYLGSKLFCPFRLVGGLNQLAALCEEEKKLQHCKGLIITYIWKEGRLTTIPFEISTIFLLQNIVSIQPHTNTSIFGKKL